MASFFFAIFTFSIMKGGDYMSKNNIVIHELYKKLVDEYEDGLYVSRATIFNRAMWDGKITERVRDLAQEYYGSLWTYVGD